MVKADARSGSKWPGEVAKSQMDCPHKVAAEAGMT
jgi:hypothetical protein